MDKPIPQWWSTHKSTLASRLTMLMSHTPALLASYTLLLLLVPTSAVPQHDARQGLIDTGNVDDRGALILEAVKKVILGSLGLDREPKPAMKASQRELRKMFKLYRERVNEMRRNSSQSVRETWQSNTSTVLFPVEPLHVLQKGDQRYIVWYRAVFQKNPKIHSKLTLTQAQLKISGSGFGNNPKTRRYIKVKINGMKPRNSVEWTNTDSNSMIPGVTLDISPEASKGLWTDYQVLVVDVGMAPLTWKASNLKPTVTLELGLKDSVPARGGRRRRSNKEDNCDEQGWCCRKSATVSFKDIGWTDWVVAPTEYTMHYCDGTCPHNYKPASMHTQVKSRLHQITKGEMPRPCCVPAAYEPMVLMHYDSRGKLKLTLFNDLIVTKCHCA
ncbi:growth/differentiation factor 15 [Poeciliopsis prolifica]|uniref:growth/differentiation factor 15 n=1 Tax=Poeciliopsis prolifica TaxID=188132 RepID=UPI0024132703|nr:growth/differentiation factor 15 [Poeciliopsis prolifica]